jgi:hypothetical protein
MEACMLGATDDASRLSCKTTTAYAALAVTLGKETADVTMTELNTAVREAAKSRVTAPYSSCPLS